MTLKKQILGLSIITILMAGCGNSNKLSERKTTGSTNTNTNSNTNTNANSNTNANANTDNTPEVNYVIKADKPQLNTTQKEILKVHNERRSNEFTDSPLSYSLDLEKEAQAYADVLAKNGKQEHDPDNAKNGYGENLFAHSTDKNIRIGEAMLQWYDEEKKIYTYETNECNTSKIQLINDAQATCGHYTQVVWQETKEVGCATAVYEDVNSSYYGGSVYVCKYTKAGNVVNQKPYCTTYATDDIYTGTIPNINSKEITKKALELELVAEDRVNCTRTDNRNGSIKFAKSMKSAQLIDFDIFNGDKYTVTLNFDKVEIEKNMVKLTGKGISAEKYPIFMNIKFVGETATYYGVELEWNGHNENNVTLSRAMKAKIYK